MLLDTHTLVWAMMAPELLSANAKETLSKTSQRCISAISLYEISFKASLGKWPEVTDLLSFNLSDKLISDGFSIISVDGVISQFAGSFDWGHRDPFDRIIVATAIHHNMPLISKDRTLDTYVCNKFTRVW